MDEISTLEQKSWQVIAHLSQQIATTFDLDTLLNDLVQTLSHSLHYPYSSIFLSDLSETALTLKAVSSHDPQFIAPAPLTLPVDEETLIGQAVTTATPYLTNTIKQDGYTRFDYLAITPRSEMAIPLITSNQVLGVLHLQSRQPNEYNLTDLYRLQPIANQLAATLDNARLLEERDRRMAELATFNQIGMVMAEQRDLETILSNTVHRVKSLLQVEGVSLLLLENDQLHFATAAGQVAEDLKAFTLTRGQGIAWSAVETQHTVRVDNVHDDPRHFKDIDSAIEFSTHSLLAVPIQTPERTLGVLEVMNRIDGQLFSRDDEVTLEFIVSSVAIAIENARLISQIQHQIDRISGLLAASHALSTLNLQDILDTIVRKAGDLLEAEHTVVYLVDDAMRQLRATASHSVGDMKNMPTPPFGFEEGTIGWVHRHKQPLKINNIQEDTRFIQMTPQSRLIVNLVAVPLLVKAEVIGVLEATHKISGKDFTREDETLLSAFASQAAIALYNARLYQETQQQVKALTILTKTSEAITKTRTLDQLLDIVLDSMLSIIGAEVGNIILTDPQNQTLHIEASRGLASDVVEMFNKLHISQKVGTFGEAYRTREIIEIEDSTTNPIIFRSPEMTWEIPKTFTNVPLSSGDDFIGLITLHALPNDDTRSLLRAVADMAAVAIDKARLFKETGQRLAEVSTLYTLAEQMTRVFDLDRTAELSVIILKHALDCSGCCLFLKEKRGDTETMILKASNGWSEASPTHPEISYLSQLAQKLAKKSYPTYIKDILRASALILPPFDLSQAYTQAEQDKLWLQIRSIIIVPLVTKDEILGVLAIGDARPDAFGQAEGRLLTIAAAQIATAIENIRLYDSLEKRAIELEVALKEVAEANRLKSEFVQNVSHELRTPLTFILSYIELMLEGSLGEIPQIIKGKLEIVSQKTQTITRLVEDIISLQKMEAGNLARELVTVYELITRANHGAIANAAQYGLEITAYSAPNLPKLYVDIDRIGQVFDNLVANALKFSPSGSKIHIAAEQDGDMIKFSVQDKGIGIPVHKLDKIFDRFYQVDGSTTRRYSGAGLGLAIIKQIVEVHGGRITVESVINEGTTFIFWLPIPKASLLETQ